MTQATSTRPVKTELVLDTNPVPRQTIGKMWATCSVTPGLRNTIQRVHFVFVLDTSESMNRHQKWAIVKASMQYMSTQITPTDYVSLTSFNSDVTTHLCAQVGTVQTRAQLVKHVNTLTPKRATNLSEALIDHVTRCLATCDDKANANVLHAVFVLTDGVATRGLTESVAILARLKQVYAPYTQRLTISTFGYGLDHRASLLYQLATTYQGSYCYMEQASDVAAAYSVVLARVRELEMAPTTLKLKAFPGCRIVGIVTTALLACNETTLAKEYALQLPLLSTGKPFQVLLKLSLNKVASDTTTHLLLTATANNQIPVSATLARPNRGEREALPSTATIVREQRLRYRMFAALQSCVTAMQRGKVNDAISALARMLGALRDDMSLQRTTPYLRDMLTDVTLCETLLKQLSGTNNDGKVARVVAYLHALMCMYGYERPTNTPWLKANKTTLEGHEGFMVNEQLMQRDASTYGYLTTSARQQVQQATRYTSSLY